MEYCCECGKALEFKTLLDGSEERYCPACNHVYFDSPCPAVIVAVTHKNRILLAQSVGWTAPHWGLIAGHIKPDETAEDAATREVHEEVDVTIGELKFLGTYAHKQRKLLMIGFHATTTDDTIRISGELEKAPWFPLYSALPLHPESIAAQIVGQLA